VPTLAIDTATPTPSLALVDETGPLAELRLGASRDGGRRVLEAVHHLLEAGGLDRADLERIVVGVGPGGFTGLRIGVATALGLGQALAVPVAGASSLEAMALAIADTAPPPDALLVPVIDARRSEVFAAAYAGSELAEVLAPAAWSPAELAEALGRQGVPAVLAGDGLTAHAKTLGATGAAALPPGSPAHAPRASDLVRRVAAGAARPVAPTYLRLPDAEVNRLAALARAG
jgi:tRNA threonylcarbamoyladenosine biosynthesis protein TsaB